MLYKHDAGVHQFARNSADHHCRPVPREPRPSLSAFRCVWRPGSLKDKRHCGPVSVTVCYIIVDKDRNCWGLLCCYQCQSENIDLNCVTVTFSSFYRAQALPSCRQQFMGVCVERVLVERVLYCESGLRRHELQEQ